MILANGINLPLLLAEGFAVFGPLTLLVAAIESLVFRVRLKIRLRAVFRPVLVANLLSTLLGVVLLVLQDAIVEGSGITASIPAFVRGYRWMAVLLIALYFAKSILVEGFWLTRRRVLEGIGRGASGVRRAVVVGNVCSYLIVGPLFYFSTRPHFGGLETTFDARWTRNPDLVVYYIDCDDQHVKRIRLGSSQPKTLIPYPALSFLVSADESAFAFVGSDGKLYAYRSADDAPILIRETKHGCFMTMVSLSPDNRWLAYRGPPQGDILLQEGSKDTLYVFDLETREAREIARLSAAITAGRIAWSADGRHIYAQVVVPRIDRPETTSGPSHGHAVRVFDAQPPYGAGRLLKRPPPVPELVENYLRVRGNVGYSGVWPTVFPRRYDRAGPYSYELYPYLGSRITVKREERQILLVRSEYGLLDLSSPIRSAFFLPSEDEILLDWWRQLYLLGLESRKLGLAANGDHPVLRTPAFRISFDCEDEGAHTPASPG